MVLGFLGNSHISSTFGQAASPIVLEVVSEGVAENWRAPRELEEKGEVYSRKPVPSLILVTGKSRFLESQCL